MTAAQRVSTTVDLDLVASAPLRGDGEPQPGQEGVTKIRASEPVQRPQPWIHPCPTCGQRFWTKPWKGRPATYCSGACRQAAYRERVQRHQNERRIDEGMGL